VPRLTTTVATMALLLSADASGLLREKPPAQDLRALQEASQASQNQPGQQDQQASPGQPQPGETQDGSARPPSNVKPGPLQPLSRLALIRYVDREFARVVKPIPAGKKGFHIKAGGPFDEKALRMALASSGSAINPGDQAQITDLQFKDRQIVVDVNGGGRGKTRLRDRIHLEVGGVPTVSATPDTPVNTNVGATLFLDFGAPLPDMSPDELKQYLSDLLDFSKQHSASVQWVETLPPEIQKAIQEKRAVPGMDHEMVLAAIGRPDRKVREKSPRGDEEEDWIYGKPPAKTTFVVFQGDKVTQIRQFPE
jgi:hypothetical protein